jgi:glycosyltransferase involved in cell wall biosynthesis
MRIGIVTAWFERGAAYVSRQYCQKLAEQHKVFIYARAGEEYAIGSPTWDDSRVTWGKKRPLVMATAIDLQDFRRWLTRNRIELVIFNEQLWWPPVVFCNELGIITGAYVDYYTEETIPLFACYDFLCCNTRRHYSAFEWHPQSVFIPWGTDIELFKPREMDGATPRSLTFFHSAGMSPRRKGTDLLLEAAAGLEGQARLVIHSQVPLSKALPDSVELACSLKSTGTLELVEETVTAPGLYRLGDVYVYPSRLEGIGLTIAEALACGLPVITTDQPPMNEFVVHGESGRLVSVEKLVSRADGFYWPQAIADVSGLRNAMEFYVDQASLLAQHRIAARQHAEDRLDWRRNGNYLLDCIAQAQKRPEAELRKAGERALDYEMRRASLQQRYPRLFYLLSLLRRPFKRMASVL